MPSKQRIFQDGIEKYLTEKEEEGMSPVTIKNYRHVLTRLFTALMDAKMTTNPRMVMKPELLYLKGDYLTCGEATRKWMMEVLTGYCKWAGNAEIGKIVLIYGDTTRKRVRWLEPQQAPLLDINAKGIEKLVIHLEKDLGMRRIELLRLKLSSFSFSGSGYGQVTIHGKGRKGGKYRTITCHPRTRMLFQEYVHGERAEEVAKVRRVNPQATIKDALFVYANLNAGVIGEYKKTALDKIVQRVSDRVGFPFTNHDLRRTCGRELYFAKVEIEKIAHILGHTDTRTTMRYLGLEFMDMQDSMTRYAEYQQRQYGLPQNQGKNALSQMKKWTLGDLNPKIILADRDFAPLFNDAVLEDEKILSKSELAMKINGEQKELITR